METRADVENSVLRWGGVAGILAGALFLVEAAVVYAFIPAGQYLRFPDVLPAVGVGAGIELAAAILWVALLVALYRALQKSSPAAALFGSVLGALGWAVFLVGTGQTATFNLISGLYHAPGATSAEQATLALMWPVARSIFNQTEVTGGFLLVLGAVLLGVAIFRAPAFGRELGWLCVIMGMLGVVGTLFFDYSSLGYTLLVVPMVIVLPVVLGWKIYSMSRRS